MQSQRQFHGLPPRSDARTRRFIGSDCAFAHSGRALAPGLRQGLRDRFTRRDVRVRPGAADADFRLHPRSGMLFVLSFLCAVVRAAPSNWRGRPRLLSCPQHPIVIGCAIYQTAIYRTGRSARPVAFHRIDALRTAFSCPARPFFSVIDLCVHRPPRRPNPLTDPPRRMPQRQTLPRQTLPRRIAGAFSSSTTSGTY